MTGLSAWWLTRSKWTRSFVVAFLLLGVVLVAPLWLWVVIPVVIALCFLGGLVHGLVDLVKRKRARRFVAVVERRDLSAELAAYERPPA